MTRLQKSALTELTAPAAVALVFLALCYFGSGLPLKKAIDYSNIAFMGLSILLRSRLRGEIKSQGENLTATEQNIVLRSYRVAMTGALGYLFLAVAIYSHFGKNQTDGDIFTYHFLIYLVGAMFVSQLIRAWAVYYYTEDPETAAKPIKFPG